MPPAMQYFDAGRAAGATAHRGRPAAHGHRRRLVRCTWQPLPGTDLALANGLLHLAIRDGLVDEDYIADADHAASPRSRPAVASYWPDRVERITGVPVDAAAGDRPHPGRRPTAR